MVDFTSIAQMLGNSGFITLFVPFILIFSIVYAALLMSNLFGDEKKINNNIKIVISLSIALIAISNHIINPSSKFDVVNVLLNALPNVALIFVAVVAILMLVGMIGGQKVYEEYGNYFTIAIIIIVSYLFLLSSGVDVPRLSFMDQGTISALLSLLVFFLIIAYVTAKDDGSKKKYPKIIKFEE